VTEEEEKYSSKKATQRESIKCETEQILSKQPFNFIT
jgi:hypothetical protein